MGFGILAFAYFLLMFPIRLNFSLFIPLAGLHSLVYIFMLMGLYQVQRRMHHRLLSISMILCILITVFMFTLPDQQVRWLIDITEPWMVLSVLYAVKKECNDKIQKSMRYFTILYVATYVLSIGIYLLSGFQVLTTQIMIPIVFIRFLLAIWIILLCRRVNSELEHMVVLEYREYHIPHTKKHTVLVITILIVSIVALYLTQGVYLKSMLTNTSSLKEIPIFYESSKVDDTYLTGLGIDVTWPNVMTGLEYDEPFFYTKDEALMEQTFYMNVTLLKNGNKVDMYDTSTQVEDEKDDMVTARVVEKAEGYQMRMNRSMRFDSIEVASNDVIEMKVCLYDKQKEVLFDQTYEIENRDALVYEGKGSGIRVKHILAGNTSLLTTPDMQISMLALPQYRDYDTMKFQMEYRKKDVVVARSNTITMENISFMPYHQGYLDAYWGGNQSWDERVFESESTIDYDQAVLIIVFQGGTASDKTIELPLEKVS